jgi:hypothetical protein
VNPYQGLFKAFAGDDLRYLVVGGVAVNLHGYPRFTGDLDVVLALDSTNHARMTDLMKRLGYTERLPISLEKFGREGAVARWLREQNVIAYTFQSAVLPQLDIDVLVTESLCFDEQDARKTVVEAWGIEVPVVSIDDLIALNRRANRAKDAEDVKALLELKAL